MGVHDTSSRRRRALGGALAAVVFVTLGSLAPAGALGRHAVGIAADSSVATGQLPPPHSVGGLDMTSFCEATTGTAVALKKGVTTGTDAAYQNWECSNGQGPVSIHAACVWEYGSTYPSLIAVATDPNNAYSWICEVAHLSSSSVAPIAASLGTPGEIFHSASHNIVSAITTVGIILFIAFPSNIFNSTFSANYAEILAIIARWRRRANRLLFWRHPSPGEEPVTSGATASGDVVDHASVPWFSSVLVVGAILGGMLNPKFGANAASIEGFGATLVSFGFGVTVSWFVSRRFRLYHQYPTSTYLKALPAGLALAAVCVVISRVSNFQPGYLYGVVVSLAFVESMEERHDAHLTAISTLSTMAIALVAWFLWIPVNHFALEPGSNVIVVIADDVLASVFIGGLVGTVVGLLPLEFMSGGTLAKWRKDVWAVIFFFAVFLLVEVELRPESGPTHPGSAPLVTAIVLFVVFGALSIGMQRYFARRKVLASTAPTPTPAPTTTPTPAPAPASSVSSDGETRVNDDATSATSATSDTSDTSDTNEPPASP